MHLRTPLQANARRRQGFTLIEIMIAVVIVAILAAIALPSFIDSVRKSRRSDAFAALSAVQQAQERWRANMALYATNAQLTVATNAVPPGLGLSETSSSSYYTIALSDTSATGYTVTGTASGSQTADTACAVIGVRMTGGNIRRGSGAGAINWAVTSPDAGNCWAK